MKLLLIEQGLKPKKERMGRGGVMMLCTLSSKPDTLRLCGARNRE